MLIKLLKSPRFLDNSGKCTWVYAGHSKKLSCEKCWLRWNLPSILECFSPDWGSWSSSKSTNPQPSLEQTSSTYSMAVDFVVVYFLKCSSADTKLKNGKCKCQSHANRERMETFTVEEKYTQIQLNDLEKYGPTDA